MNLIFLTGLFLNNQIKEIESNSIGNIQYAANALQWNFVRGLVENLESKVQIINAPLIGSYPMYYKKIHIRKFDELYKEATHIRSVSFINIAIVKNFFIRKAILKELKSVFRKEIADDYQIVVYGLISPWVLSAIDIKKKFPNIKLCLIVPDLPEYFSDYKSIIHKLRKKIQPDLYKYISQFDSFVFLTAEMLKHFKIENKPWVVIEGMVNPDEIVLSDKNKKSEKKIVLYTGTLAHRYGILDLLHAFIEIKDENFELWICGAGDTENQIKLTSKQDKRIKFFGLLPREQILNLQRNATVLVNPRSAEGEYTKYSFPSKIMEYMLSGTPCIIKSLPGMPIEYNDYLYIIEDNNILTLRNKIIEICNKNNNELIEFGKAAQEFVLREKNYYVQSKKMVEMLESTNFVK